MKIVFPFLFLILPLLGLTQKLEEITHRTINIHHTDSTITLNVLVEKAEIKPKSNIRYYWYHRDVIHSNQGGYKEKLLDGKYQVITKDGKLITEGYFQFGMKIGVWKKWNKKGELLAISKWDKGVQNGNQEEYENGQISKKYNYKKGLLHSKYITYQNDTISNEVAYKKGVLIEEKPEKEEVVEKESKKVAKKPKHKKSKKKE